MRRLAAGARGEPALGWTQDSAPLELFLRPSSGLLALWMILLTYPCAMYFYFTLCPERICRNSFRAYACTAHPNIPRLDSFTRWVLPFPARSMSGFGGPKDADCLFFLDLMSYPLSLSPLMMVVIVIYCRKESYAKNLLLLLLLYQVTVCAASQRFSQPPPPCHPPRFQYLASKFFVLVIRRRFPGEYVCTFQV